MNRIRMIRKFLIPCALFCALLAAGSCERVPAGGDGRSRVSFLVLEPFTKGAVNAGGESVVSTLDLLAFRRDGGMLDGYFHVSSGDRIDAELSAGVPIRWYLVANAPAGAQLSSFGTEEAFLSALTLLTQTTSASMVMSADGTDTFSVAGPNVVEDIALERYACKVSVEDITVEWLSDFQTVPACTVDRVFLANVRGSVPWSGVPTAAAGDLWYNPSRDDPHGGLLGALLGADCGLAVSSGEAACTLGVSLYAMPNASAADDDASVEPWAPRRTRLCIRLIIGGVPQWYAVDLPAMQRNRHYIVSELVIAGPGTAEPDMHVDRTDVVFSVTVAPWADEDVDAGTFPVDP